MGTVQRIKERGDTIIEVMIAIAVVGSILAQAYAIANRSLQSTQTSQERSESVKIAEQQIELLRDLAKTDPDAVFGSTNLNIFCIRTAGANTGERTDFPADFTIVDYTLDNFEDYPAECRNLGGGNRYNVLIERESSTSGLFTFYSRWDRVGGGKNEVKLVYRLHPSSSIASPIIDTTPPPPGTPPPPPPTGCDDSIISVPETFIILYPANPRLGDPNGTYAVRSIDTPLKGGCTYTVVLTGIETGHVDPGSPFDNQPYESIFIEGLTGSSPSSEVTFRTRQTPDIPGCPNPRPNPGSGSYINCTRQSTGAHTIYVTKDTTHIKINHVAMWNNSWGCGNNICSDADGARDSRAGNSIHGALLVLTNND